MLFMVLKLEFEDGDLKGKSKCVQGEVEKHHPSGILTLYSVIYNDGDVGLLDPEETKKQVDLHNEMKKQVNLHKEMNDDYDE